MKKYLIILFILLCPILILQSQDLNKSIEDLLQNQNKIITLIGKGKMTFKMKSEALQGGENNMESDVSLYVKSPEKIKLVTNGMMKSEIVQVGGTLIKKINGISTGTTEPVTGENDLFGKYISFNMEFIKKNAKLISSEAIMENNMELYKYRVNIEQEKNDNDMNQMFKIDYNDLYFSKDGLIVKNISYVNGTPFIIVEYFYQIKKGIYLIKTIRSNSTINGISIQNTIEYTDLKVNVPVSDDEFIIM